MSIGYINGKFIDINETVIPIEERGHQFGDGVYEVIKVYGTTPFHMEEHLERFEKSAKAIKLKMPYTFNELKNIILEGIKKSGVIDAEVYFQATRGIAPRNHLFPQGPASFTMTIKPVRQVPKENYTNGITVMTADDDRWANCHIKSLNLLPNILAKQAANNNDDYEAVLVKDGHVTEGSSTNIFVVRDQVLYTTPLTSNILSGITREAVLKIAKELAIEVVEESYSTKFLFQADEAFLTSTIVEVLPISAVDDIKISDGTPGPITKKIHEAYIMLTKE